MNKATTIIEKYRILKEDKDLEKIKDFLSKLGSGEVKKEGNSYVITGLSQPQRSELSKLFSPSKYSKSTLRGNFYIRRQGISGPSGD